jgi:mannitol 2-dehydrogenase
MQVSRNRNWLTGLKKKVTFPNSMVDRITPVTTRSDIETLKSIYSIYDKCPIVCEPFIQWVSEDNFSNVKPDWESAGTRNNCSLVPIS